MRTKKNFYFTLNSEEEFWWTKEKVVVVSVIGKSSGCIPSEKDRLFYQITGRSLNRLVPPNGAINSDAWIEGFYNAQENVVYLHLHTPLDTALLSRRCQIMKDKLEESGFLACWSDLRFSVARALLFVFSMSHVVILHNPGHVFDVSYLALLHCVDVCRQKLQDYLADTLDSVSGVAAGWLTHGRLCPPRLLLYFSRCPSVLTADPKSAGHLVEQLHRNTEDQIYKLFRRFRFITNLSSQSLFALPANQPFVWFNTDDNPLRQDSLMAELDLLQKMCSIADEKPSDLFGSACGAKGSFPMDLVNQHIQLALSRGFDDNTGKHLPNPHFDLPVAEVWYEVACVLYKDLVDSAIPQMSDVTGHWKSLIKLHYVLDADSRFSETRCSKVLPLAVSTYQEGLPSRYSKASHMNKVALAMNTFQNQARGPSCAKYLRILEAECEKIWQQGRRMCEILSLTGNPCINPVHRLPEEESDDSLVRRPVMKHCSGVRYLATCNCGRTQVQKDDPFHVRYANYEFYLEIAKQCCVDFLQHVFPVFRPSASKPKAAVLRASGKTHLKTFCVDATANEISLTPSFGQGLSQGESDEEEPKSDGESVTASEMSLTVRPEAASSLEVTASTEEYLDGMLTTATPGGLLPLYPSFSITCTGPSSFYSHASGLQGFIQGSNYLLPWEMRMKSERQQGSYKYGKKRDFYDIYAKIFIGFEYECPRGHRFFMAARDRVMKSPSSAQLKENVSAMANNDMPLFFNCPCSKKLKPFVGQLMRIHVVTPKSAVRVTLDVRVQPRPPHGAVFVLGAASAVELTPSDYWTCRLPHLYLDGDEVVAPPRHEVPHTGLGRLLPDVFGIVIRDEM